MSDLRRLAPNKTFRNYQKDAFHSRQVFEKEFDNILNIGLVLAVDYYGNKETGVAPYSLKVRLNKSFNNLGNDTFIPPLLPIHNISLPQVGERVWILFPTPGAKTTGFWVSRVNFSNDFSSNSIQKIDVSSIYNDNVTKELEDNQLFGPGLTRKNIKEKIDVEPKDIYNVSTMRIKPGDVITHGRSNTHSIHTFDTDNKKGVIDLITEVDKNKKDFYKQEFHISNGARSLLVTENNLDKKVIEEDLELQFEDTFVKEENNKSYALLQADQIRLISPNGKEVNHLILAEKNNKWTEEFIKIIKNYIDKNSEYIEKLHDTINNITNNYDIHTHLSPVGPTSPTTNLLTPTINGKILELNSKKEELNNIKSILDDQFSKLPETYSEKVACN